MDFLSLLGNIWAVFLIISFFGGSIFVHELGHFMAARRYGLKVERFSIGFGPKLIGWTHKGVEYRLALFPFGGSVALPQLADMGLPERQSGRGALKLPPVSYHAIVTVAVMGAVFNLLFALVLSLVLWMVGQPTSDQVETTTIGYVSPTLYLDPNDSSTEVESPAHKAGLQPGDVVLTVDGNPVNNFQDIQYALATGVGRDAAGKPQSVLSIERQSQPMSLDLSPELVVINPGSGDRMRSIGISPAHALTIKSIKPNSPAEKADLQLGDQIIAADEIPIYSLASFLEEIEDKAGQPASLTIQRGDQTRRLSVIPQSTPYTKPLGQIEIIAKGLSASFKLQPFYLEEPPASSESADQPASLRVHETQDPSGILLHPQRIGDRLVAVNDQSVTSLEASIASIQTALQANAPIRLYFQPEKKRFLKRSAYTLQLSSMVKPSILPPQQRPLIGVIIQQNTRLLHLNPIEQFSRQLKTTFQVLKSVFHPRSDIGIQHLSGPIGIIRVFSWFSDDLRLILVFTVLLNINLAILNLLPIPVLDGGHILFATLNKLRGKPLPRTLLTAIQGAFVFIFFFGLIFYIGFFDVSRIIGDNESKERNHLHQSVRIEPVFKKETSLQ